MRKIILTALITVSLISSAFATEKNKISHLIRNSFSAEFGNVKDVEWTTGESFATASFYVDDKKVQAFYEYNGNLIGTSQAIPLTKLPASAKRAFVKKYYDYTVTEAIKFERGDETAYFISAKLGSKPVVLKVLNGQVSIFK